MKKIFAILILLSATSATATATATAADPTLVFYNGSTSVCRPEFNEKGLCKPSDLTRCIVVRNQMRQAAKCSATGTANFIELETGNTKSVEDKVDLELAEGESSTVCFDYNRNLYKLWSFQSFEKFAGVCGQEEGQKPDPQQSPVQAETESELLNFRLDNEKCASGWPCNKIEVKKTSLHIDEKSKAACLNYSNKSLKTMRCDLRLDVQLRSGIESAIRRQEKLFYNQEQTVCFPFENLSEGFVNIKDMGVVCRHLDDRQSPENACDLEKGLCAVETEQTLILAP